MSMGLIGWLLGSVGPYQPCDSSIGSMWYVLIIQTDAHKGGNLSYSGHGITGVSELYEVKNIVHEFICIRKYPIPCRNHINSTNQSHTPDEHARPTDKAQILSF